MVIIPYIKTKYTFTDREKSNIYLDKLDAPLQTKTLECFEDNKLYGLKFSNLLNMSYLHVGIFTWYYA